MTARELQNAAEFVKDRLYYVSIRKPPAANTMPNCHFFSIDRELVFWNFFLDFGPLSLCQTFRFCQMLKRKLDDPGLRGKKIYYYSSHHPHRRTNAAVLICAFSVLFLKRGADEAYKPFKNYYPRFTDFHDASPIACTYKLTVYDCVMGIEKAFKSGLFDFENDGGETFKIDEYEHYEKVEHGDLNWIHFKRCMAFAGPQHSREAGLLDGYSTLMPEDYFDYFKKYKVFTVIRLNKRYYDEKRFEPIGVKVIDIYFRDGSVPTIEQVRRYNEVCEGVPDEEAYAVHCKAGLGRTGTLIGCNLMKHFGFTHNECIGWIRVCRPGSIIGPQQHFLQEMQDLMWREGEKFRKAGKGSGASPKRRQANKSRGGSLSKLFGSLSLKQDSGSAGNGAGNEDEWVEAVDAVSGKTYYYNRYTRESRWTRPGATRTNASTSGIERKDSQGDELMRNRRSPTNAGGATQSCSPVAKSDQKGYFRSQ